MLGERRSAARVLLSSLLSCPHRLMGQPVCWSQPAQHHCPCQADDLTSAPGTTPTEKAAGLHHLPRMVRELKTVMSPLETRPHWFHHLKPVTCYLAIANNEQSLLNTASGKALLKTTHFLWNDINRIYLKAVFLWTSTTLLSCKGPNILTCPSDSSRTEELTLVPTLQRKFSSLDWLSDMPPAADAL